MIRLARRRMLTTTKREPRRVSIPVRGRPPKRGTKTVPAVPRIRPRLGINHR